MSEQEIETRATIMARIHELSCKHEHRRADECLMCMAEFEPIIQQLLAQKP